MIARNGFWEHGPLGYHLPQKGTKSTKEEIQSSAFRTLFSLFDRSNFFGQGRAELREDVDQQVDLCKAYATVPFRSEKEFELDNPLAVSYEHDIVSPLIRTFIAGLDRGLNVRGQMS
jgi:hypothetical protein